MVSAGPLVVFAHGGVVWPHGVVFGWAVAVKSLVRSLDAQTSPFELISCRSDFRVTDQTDRRMDGQSRE